MKKLVTKVLLAATIGIGALAGGTAAAAPAQAYTLGGWSGSCKNMGGIVYCLRWVDYNWYEEVVLRQVDGWKWWPTA